jgi:DNA-binding MarR family transcriptional regulator
MTSTGDSPGEQRERTLQLLHRLVLPLDRTLQVADRQSGCSAAQLSALSAIHHLGKQSITDIAAHERIAPATVSRLVEGLVRQGLAERRPDPEDRRIMRLAVTARGLQAIETACDARASALRQRLVGLSDAEWAALGDAVRALNTVFGYVRPALNEK